MAANMPNQISPQQTLQREFRVGDWLIQPSLGRITNGASSERVEPKVMAVLLCLAQQPGGAVTREQLLETVWADAFVTEDALHRAISRLRKVFDDDPKNPAVIETISKIGYRLIAPVAPAPAPTAPQNGQATPDDLTIPANQIAALGEQQPLEIPSAERQARRLSKQLLFILAVTLAGASWFVWRQFLRPSPATSLSSIRITPLTSLPGREVTQAIAPDGSRVAFAWRGPSGDNLDIYLKQPGTETLLRLTNHPARELNPAWAPDGGAIAFARIDKDGCGIYAIPAQGGVERKLTDCHPASEPDLAWSADGKWLAFTDRAAERAPHKIFLLALDTYEKRPLTSLPAEYVGENYLAFSPVEPTLAFSRSSALGVEDIYLLPLSGVEPRRLTFDNLKIHGLTWTPDGKRIVYSSNRGGSFSLWQVAAAGGTPEWVAAGGSHAEEPSLAWRGARLVYQLWDEQTDIWRIARIKGQEPSFTPLIASTRWEWNPQFSPDGKQLAFVSDRSGAAEIWLAERNGENPIQLTSFKGPYTNNPRWSPDGGSLVFETPAHGNFDIYTINKTGGAPRRLTSAASEERAPSWSRDGRWIYFASNRNGEWQVWKLASEGGAEIQVTTHGGFAASESPDGAWLYFTKQSAPGLWRAPAQGGAEEQVLDKLNPVDWNNWALAPEGVYFIERTTPDRPVIAFFDLRARQTTALATPPQFLYKSGLAISTTGEAILYTRVASSEADLMLIDNFRYQ